MKKGQDLSKSNQLDFARSLLKSIFKEAKEKGEMLWPDDALIKFMELMNKSIEINEIDIQAERLRNPKVNYRALFIDLHHYAVDLFYEILWGKRIGAPQIDEGHLNHILELHSLGLTYLEIAKSIDLPINTKEERKSSKEIVRKRLAKKRIVTLKKE